MIPYTCTTHRKGIGMLTLQEIPSNKKKEKASLVTLMFQKGLAKSPAATRKLFLQASVWINGEIISVVDKEIMEDKEVVMDDRVDIMEDGVDGMSVSFRVRPKV